MKKVKISANYCWVHIYNIKKHYKVYKANPYCMPSRTITKDLTSCTARIISKVLDS